MVIHVSDKMLIGDGGFKGKPDEEGKVEIGYSIVPEYRRRGFATEVARALVDYAFSQPGVKAVEAHTLANGTASIKVLKKAGMSFVAEFHDPEDGLLFQWRLDKEAYNNSSRAWPSAS
jgi:ribosomal-protein-alanine N-acetyltransferase